MPDMKGIDFLKKINHLPIKKALITGEKDYKIGIDAFNADLVDAYIRKDDPDFDNQIQNIVSELEWKYFIELSNLISDISHFDYLRNDRFVSIFKQFIHANDIIAFCLTHTEGDFYTQNKRKGQQHILVRNKIQLRELSKIAEEDGASEDTVENLKLGKAIPFFDTVEYWQIPASEWDILLYPTTSVLDDPDLVWTIVNTKA
jgi:hypothetical protein